MANNKKDLDCEVNLISFISLLSVLICSLLLTAVWIQVGSINVKQAIGGQSQDETPKKPALWAKFDNKGSIVLEIQDSKKIPSSRQRVKFALEAGSINFSTIEKAVSAFRQLDPELEMALIQPSSETVYEDIIALMDHFKEWGIRDLGVAPL